MSAARRKRPPPEVVLVVNGKKMRALAGARWTIFVDTVKRRPVHRHLRKVYVTMDVSRP